MTLYLFLLALLIGVVAGLRAMTAPAAVSWAAHLGALHLGGTWLAFLGNVVVAWVLTALALGELITDQLPKTPSRKVPVQFGARIVSGALCGAAVGTAAGMAAQAWPLSPDVVTSKTFAVSGEPIFGPSPVKPRRFPKVLLPLTRTV